MTSLLNLALILMTLIQDTCQHPEKDNSCNCFQICQVCCDATKAPRLGDYSYYWLYPLSLIPLTSVESLWNSREEEYIPYQGLET